MLILAVGAAVGTFIENDYGNARAKELVYNSIYDGLDGWMGNGRNFCCHRSF